MASYQGEHMQTTTTHIWDYFDGAVFQHLLKEGYIQHDTDIILQLYVDGVSLFNSSTFSIKPLLLMIMNLPPALRVQQKYMICIGIVPGPAAKGQNLGAFMQPLIDKLKIFDGRHAIQCWNGHTNTVFNLRVILIACGADLPGSTQLAGHVGFNSSYPCRICGICATYGAKAVQVPTCQPTSYDIEGMDLLVDYDVSNLPMRTNNRHCEEMLMVYSGNNYPIRHHRVRYTRLMQLPTMIYPWAVPVDSMHHLFEGVTKFMFEL